MILTHATKEADRLGLKFIVATLTSPTGSGVGLYGKFGFKEVRRVQADTSEWGEEVEPGFGHVFMERDPIAPN